MCKDSSLAWMNTFLDVAEIISQRSHCCSKKVCAIAVNDGRIIGTGINGSIKGQQNCDDVFGKEDMSKSEVRERHHKWSLQHELHAEQNLVLDLAKRGVSLRNADVFVSLQPCENCARLLSQSGIHSICWRNHYDKGNLSEALESLLSANIQVRIFCKNSDDYLRVCETLKNNNYCSMSTFDRTIDICYKNDLKGRPRTKDYGCLMLIREYVSVI